MAVDACCRGRGIGTGLLERLMDEFSKSGADLMLLNCPAEAVEAKRLYDKMRFTVRAYHMMKRL